MSTTIRFPIFKTELTSAIPPGKVTLYRRFDRHHHVNGRFTGEFLFHRADNRFLQKVLEQIRRRQGDGSIWKNIVNLDIAHRSVVGTGGGPMGIDFWLLPGMLVLYGCADRNCLSLSRTVEKSQQLHRDGDVAVVLAFDFTALLFASFQRKDERL